MAFNRLMLTTDGKTLYAKAQQGKPLQFTRVGVGDGNIGSGSLVNRTALINQKISLLIDTIQLVNENESAIITTIKNMNLSEGFYFREIGIFAKDPDTQQEKLYLYDNAGDDGEYIPDNQSGVIVNERLKFLLLVENVTTVSFVPSGDPIYLTTEDIDDILFGECILWSSAKTKAEIDAARAAANDYADIVEVNARSYTNEKLAELIATAPAALDTLKELSAALGDDPNFSATVLNLIGQKADQTTVTAHLNDTMPHRFVDGEITYRWGLSVVDGVVTMIYEEVV